MKKRPYEGLQENIRKLELPPVDVWENKYQEKRYLIRFETREFTCICPKTGLPDFAHIYIEYLPGKWCIELKSFKEYLVAYRSLGVFHENAVNRILADLAKACKPRWMKVTSQVRPRGGMTTDVVAEYKQVK